MSKFTEIAEKLLKSKGSPAGSPLSPVKDQIEQSPDEQKLAEYVRSKIDLVRQTNSRIAIEGIYLTNVAYLLGFDGVYYDTTYRQFRNVDPKRKVTRNRFKVNKILPSIQNRLSRLTQSPPRYDVRPNSNSTADKDAARLGLEIIQDIFDKQRFRILQQELMMSAMQGGHSYLQVIWDPTLGKPMIDPETGELTGYEGDVRLEVLNCLEVFCDPLAKNLEDAQWVIKAKVRKLDYFKEQYPERGGAVKEEDAWLLSSLYDMKANALTSVGIVGASTNDQMKNSAIELVYYEKRSKEYPNGRKIVVANGVILDDKELPIGEYDLVKFDDIMIGGRYNSEAVITHLRPVQDQYNISRTKMADWLRKMLAGKYIAPKGSGLSQEAINNESGEVVEYNPVANGLSPQPMNVPQIPPYAYKEIETLDAEFDYISGINEISRGVLPAAGMPAAGMAFLQEQDQTRIGVQTTRNEVGYAKVGSKILKYVSKYYVMPRMLKLAGDGLDYAVKEFMGADIKDNTDVICIPGSTIPSSKVLRREDIMNAFTAGLLGNPQDPEVRAQVLEWMEYGDEFSAWKKQALDSAQVQRVIKAIEENDDITIKNNLSEFDNQDWHLLKMNEYRLTDKYSELSDEQKNKFLWVMEWRLQAKINAANPQIGQQQILAQQMVSNMHSQFGDGGQMNPQGQMNAPLPLEESVPNQTPGSDQAINLLRNKGVPQ